MGAYYFPSFTSDGGKILYTSEGYTGLWSFDLSTKQAQVLTTSMGAGYQPISLTGNTVVYRQDKYVNRLKHTSFVQLDLSSGNEKQLSEPARFVTSPVISGRHLNYFEDKRLVKLEIEQPAAAPQATEDVSLLTNGSKLQLIRNGAEADLMPLGEGNYIWAELSPSKDRFVFTMVGQGTYVYSIDGRMISNLGHASAPHWSLNGKYLVYMRDFDNGVQYTKSEIWVSSADGSRSWQITDTPARIEMYPHFSPDNSQIIYHTHQGEIFITEIQFVN